MLGFAQAAVRDARFRGVAGRVADWWWRTCRETAWPSGTSTTRRGRRPRRAHLPDRALVDGCLNRTKDLAVGHELVWGDYFLLAAALGLRQGLATTSL